MIVYHESSDIYHCIYRMCLIVSMNRMVRIPIAQCKTLDYFLLFPFLVATCKLPREHVSIRKAASKLANRYNSQFDKKTMFYRIEPIQDAALTLLSCIDIIDEEVLRTGFVAPGNRQIPEIIYNNIVDKTTNANEVTDFILRVLGKMPWSGEKGLKSRSQLMENRYDL